MSDRLTHDWAQLLGASFTELQDAPAELRQVPLGVVAQELAGSAHLAALPPSVMMVTTQGQAQTLLPQLR